MAVHDMHGVTSEIIDNSHVGRIERKKNVKSLGVGHYESLKARTVSMALGISGVLGGLGVPGGSVYAQNPANTLPSALAGEVVGKGEADPGKVDIYDLPFSVREEDVAKLGLRPDAGGGELLSGGGVSVGGRGAGLLLAAGLPSPNIKMPTASSLREAIVECGASGLPLDGAYTYGPSETMAIGQQGQFRTIMVFGDRRIGYVYIDMSRYLGWPKCGPLESLGGGNYINKGGNGDTTAQVRPDIINLLYGGGYVRYAQYAWVRCTGVQKGNKYSQGIQVTVSPEGMIAVPGVGNVSCGNNGTIKVSVVESYVNNRYPPSDITNHTSMYVEPVNGKVPDWVWCEKGGKVRFGEITKPSICSVTVVSGTNRSSLSLYFLPEPPIQQLQVMAPTEVMEGEKVPLRIIAHYPIGWTPRDVTDQARIVWKSMIINRGTMGSQPYFVAPQVRHRERETIQVHVRPYDEKLINRSMPSSLAQLYQTGATASISVDVKNTPDNGDEFIQVVDEKTGETEYIHRDDYDYLMKTRNGGADEVTSAGARQDVTLTSSHLRGIQMPAIPVVRYGEAVGGAKLGLEVPRTHLVAGESITPKVWYAYKNISPKDISETLRVQTDSQHIFVRDGKIHVHPHISQEAKADVWVSTVFKGQPMMSQKVTLTLSPLVFEVSAAWDKVISGGSVKLGASVRSGGYTNTALGDIISWKASAGEVKGGVYHAPGMVAGETQVTITGSFMYAGKRYVAQVGVTVVQPAKTTPPSASTGTPNTPGMSNSAIKKSVVTDITSMQTTIKGYSRVTASYEQGTQAMKQYAGDIGRIGYEVSLRSAALMILSGTPEMAQKNQKAISYLAGEANALLEILKNQKGQNEVMEIFAMLLEELSAPGEAVRGWISDKQGDFYEHAWEIAFMSPGADMAGLMASVGGRVDDVLGEGGESAGGENGEGIVIERAYRASRGLGPEAFNFEDLGYLYNPENTNNPSPVGSGFRYEGITSANQPIAQALKMFLPGTRTTHYTPKGYEYCELTFIVDYYNGTNKSQLYPAKARFAYKLGSSWTTSGNITINSFQAKQKAFEDLWKQINGEHGLGKAIVGELIYAKDESEILKGSLAFFPFMEDVKDASTNSTLPQGFYFKKIAYGGPGVDVKIYQNDTTQEVIIASGGSDEFVQDWLLTNTKILWQNPQQFDKSLEIIEGHVQELRNMEKNYRVICVGHSLGGAIAEYIGQCLDIPTLTFGAPGIDKDSWEDIIRRNPEMNARSLRVIVKDGDYQDLVTTVNPFDDFMYSPQRNVRKPISVSSQASVHGLVPVGSIIHGEELVRKIHPLPNYKNSISNLFQ